MGIVGAVVVARWAKRLITGISRVLLDREKDRSVVDEIWEAIEAGGRESETRVADLRAWRVGKASCAWAVSVVPNDKTLTCSLSANWCDACSRRIAAVVDSRRTGHLEWGRDVVDRLWLSKACGVWQLTGPAYLVGSHAFVLCERAGGNSVVRILHRRMGLGKHV